jgi:hypothetical protein
LFCNLPLPPRRSYLAIRNSHTRLKGAASMSMCLSFCLSIYLSVSLSVYTLVHLFYLLWLQKKFCDTFFSFFLEHFSHFFARNWTIFGKQSKCYWVENMSPSFSLFWDICKWSK